MVRNEKKAVDQTDAENRADRLQSKLAQAQSLPPQQRIKAESVIMQMHNEQMQNIGSTIQDLDRERLISAPEGIDDSLSWR